MCDNYDENNQQKETQLKIANSKFKVSTDYFYIGNNILIIFIILNKVWPGTQILVKYSYYRCTPNFTAYHT